MVTVIDWTEKMRYAVWMPPAGNFLVSARKSPKNRPKGRACFRTRGVPLWKPQAPSPEDGGMFQYFFMSKNRFITKATNRAQSRCVKIPLGYSPECACPHCGHEITPGCCLITTTSGGYFIELLVSNIIGYLAFLQNRCGFRNANSSRMKILIAFVCGLIICNREC